MQMPSMLEGESLKRLLQGAAAGAVATIFVGFYWGGWSLGSTADKMATQRSELAVIAALAPVCADKFRALPDAEAKQVALSKVDSWKRRDEFPKEFVRVELNITHHGHGHRQFFRQTFHVERRSARSTADFRRSCGCREF